MTNVVSTLHFPVFLSIGGSMAAPWRTVAAESGGSMRQMGQSRVNTHIYTDSNSLKLIQTHPNSLKLIQNHSNSFLHNLDDTFIHRNTTTQLLTIYCVLSTVYCLLATGYFLQATAYCIISTALKYIVYCLLLSTVYSLTATVCYLMSTVYYLLS